MSNIKTELLTILQILVSSRDEDYLYNWLTEIKENDNIKINTLEDFIQLSKEQIPDEFKWVEFYKKQKSHNK